MSASLGLSSVLLSWFAAPVAAQVPALPGFVVEGALQGEFSGSSVANAGDVNGDGIPDFIIGARGADLPGKVDAGRAYVVFGKRSNTAPIDLANLGSGGFVINGAATGDRAGSAVAGAGDVNGDGIPDLLVGARDADPPGRSTAGRAYVVFGKRGDTSPIDLANLGSGGFVIEGAVANDRAGFSAAGAADVNGDDLADVVVGALYSDPQGRLNAGRAYVVFGKASTTPVDLSTLGSGGFAIEGAIASELAGTSVAGAGDVNGDGIPDLLVGATGANSIDQTSAGRAYVVFGKRGDTNPIDLANLGSGGFAIEGAAAFDNTGRAVSGVGDVNGDGIPDLLIGVSAADTQGGDDAGRAVVVFGKRGNTDPIFLNALGEGGFSIEGAATGDVLGSAVASAGDVNGDGLTDLLVGGSGVDPQGRTDAGGAYVVFGKATSTPVDLTNLGSDGFAIAGAAAYDQTGYSVAPAGDVNGDGIADFLVGAQRATPQNRSLAGRVYLVFGKRGNTDPIDLATPGFTIPAPVISSFSPESGPVGTVVTLNGINLAGATVSFGAVAAIPSATTDTEIFVSVPTGASSGPIAVTTTQGSASTATSFIVIAPPVITGFTPTSGPRGTTVTISGSGFSGASAVTINGVVATNLSVLNDGQITVQVPFRIRTGSGPIAVTTSTGTTTSADDFTVTRGVGTP